ncbi:MAG: response regulator transcription factor [bacterium]|nr:response regulator transcription factor [bacterium]
MRILVIEDERHLAEALVHLLKKQNYAVDNDYDGESGLDDALSGIYDVIVLDIMLPKLNGYEVLDGIRKGGVETPVIMLTAKGTVSDKVRGLDCGADDYLTKPFDTEELLARIRALGRRRGEITENNAVISYGDLSLNTNTMELSSPTGSIQLTLKEKELIEYLILRRDMISPKEQIIEKLWGFESDAGDNHVEVYVSFLRKKLRFIHSSVTISAVRGVGYVLKEG